MKRFSVLLAVISFILFSHFSYAQDDYETYKRQQQAEYNRFRQNEIKKFQQYKDSLNREYKQYRDSCYQALKRLRDSLNIEFARQLKQKWQKNKTRPPHRPDGFQGWKTILPPRFSPAAAKVPANKNHFFGIPLNFSLPEKIPFQLKQPTETAIADAWLHLNQCNLSDLIITCQLIAKDKNLNSWAYYQMLCWLSEKIFPAQAKNEKIIFRFFMLVQSGYKCRIGYNEEKRLTLLLPFNVRIFYRNYQEFGNTPYYIIEKELAGDTISTYSFEFPEASRIPDLYLHRPPRFGNDRTEYKEFPGPDKNYRIKLPVNKHLIDFYTTYPFCQLSVYNQTTPSPQLAAAIEQQFSALLNAADTTEKVSRLLKFMHTAFHYKTDQEYWGRERYFFPEESLYYPCLDCEDYAILFCYLTRILTGAPTILVAYPEHMATAVRLRQDIKKGYILHKTQKYTLYDPAFKGSLPGEVIPAVSNARSRIIE